ncbi:MAG: hypothetical protein ACYSWX_13835, partial [Planctomycetota bacterium]
MSRSKLAGELAGTFDHDELTGMTRDLLEELGNASITDELLRYTNDKGDLVSELVDALEAIEDEDELYRTITDLWLELKFEWARYN